jgi:hypothetical protein
MEETRTNSANTSAGAESAAGHGCFICNVALPLMERYWSESTNDHFRNARVEFLKGIRSLIDSRIDHLSRHQPQHGTRVTVE